MNKTILQEAIVVVVLSIIFAGGAHLLRSELTPTATMSNTIQSSAKATQLDAEQTHMLFGKGEALFIDGRSQLDFALGHIPGAINIPLEKIQQETAPFAALPHDKRMVVYCSNALCNKAERLATKLSKQGFMVAIFVEGYDAWQANGWETESSQ